MLSDSAAFVIASMTGTCDTPGSRPAYTVTCRCRFSRSTLLGAVPAAIDPAAVRIWLAGRSGVTAVHDLHIWSMSTTDCALTAHLVMPGGHPGDAFLMATAAGLQQRFGISHVTVQIETDPCAACPLEPDHVV